MAEGTGQEVRQEMALHAMPEQRTVRLDEILRLCGARRCGAMQAEAWFHPRTFVVHEQRQEKPWICLQRDRSRVYHGGFVAYLRQELGALLGDAPEPARPEQL